METIHTDGSGFDAPLTLETESSVSSAASPVLPDNDESDFYLANNDSGSSLSLSHEEREEREFARIQQECKETPVHRLPNEIMMMIFAKIDRPSDILRCMLTCKRWARNSVDLLWHRPACTSIEKMERICNALHAQLPFFQYSDYVRRINLSQMCNLVNDGTIDSLKKCNRIERLTLTNCKQVTDSGLISLVSQNHHMLALDISANQSITDQSIMTVADNCPRLQGLNIAGCVNVTSQSLVALANNCRQIKRIKLNDILNVTDEAVLAFAENCPNLLEIDLQMCHEVGNVSVTALLSKGKALRELRLPYLHLITDNAFLPISEKITFDALRILDLTGCYELTDAAVVKIIDAAPRLRNVVLAKCRNITNVAVNAISKLGKNLHYVHLGHCSLITDDGARQLINSCNRIRYIDLGCCTALTDASVSLLANLPKLKRIGLVKCSQITDSTINSIAFACIRRAQRPNSDGTSGACLERVHLSYCMNLTLKSIIRLLNSCRRLTHLSLTGVPAFLIEDFQRFGREPPAEFTVHQRQVFCVFSGTCVSRLRDHLNTSPRYQELRRSTGIYRPTGDGLFEFDSMMPTPVVDAAPTLQNGVVTEADAWEADLDEDDLMNDVDAPGGNEAAVGLMAMHQLQQNLPVIAGAPPNDAITGTHLVPVIDQNGVSSVVEATFTNNSQFFTSNPQSQQLIYNYFVSQIEAGLMPMPTPGEAAYNLITIHEQNMAIQTAQMAAGNSMLNSNLPVQGNGTHMPQVAQLGSLQAHAHAQASTANIMHNLGIASQPTMFTNPSHTEQTHTESQGQGQSQAQGLDSLNAVNSDGQYPQQQNPQQQQPAQWNLDEAPFHV
ncbi:hypothetical protein BROUX41_003879 [Berkeleyomyces rouxiae]|uniref:uncharacterized protein n=1 Tax=Berkeleyomyces rouxiae TaxID=2035830 RepID=UPI003B7B36E5